MFGPEARPSEQNQGGDGVGERRDAPSGYAKHVEIRETPGERPFETLKR